MQNQIITTNEHSRDRRLADRSWPQAYLAFLLSKNESFILKVAPLALILGMPEVIASNFLPIIGEVSDLGEIVLWAVVIWRTVVAVRRYHKRDT